MDFTNINIKNAILEYSQFNRCNFKNAILENVSFIGASLNNADFENSNLKDIKLNNLFNALKGHKSCILSIALSKSGKYLASASGIYIFFVFLKYSLNNYKYFIEDNTVIVWDILNK
jgi:WD40 repeat protein